MQTETTDTSIDSSPEKPLSLPSPRGGEETTTEHINTRPETAFISEIILAARRAAKHDAITAHAYRALEGPCLLGFDHVLAARPGWEDLALDVLIGIREIIVQQKLPRVLRDELFDIVQQGEVYVLAWRRGERPWWRETRYGAK